MIVYLEYALLDNFTMDCILLFCAAVTLKIPFKKWRVVLGSVVGTAIALCTVNIRGALNYLCKAACLFLMCLTAVGFGKKLFWYILLTAAYTFVMGGAIVGVFNLLNVSYLTENGLCYNMPVPLFVYFIAVALTIFLCYSIAVFVKQTKKIAPYLRKVILTLGSAPNAAVYKLTGFCDTGNTVMFDNCAVCFVTKRFGNISDYFASQILTGNSYLIEVETLTGAQTVSAVEATIAFAEEPDVQHKIYLALPAARTQAQYHLLLNGQFAQDDTTTCIAK